MREEPVKLYFLCGKMAAGKSTFAKGLARAQNAVLLVQDEFLAALYPGEIQTIQDFAQCAARLREALSVHIRDILSHGVPVVLDFPGNTRTQRQWFRALAEAANVELELHFIDAPDDLCKRQLRQRSQALPVGSAWSTEAEFDAITAYFEAPTEEENFNVVRHGSAYTEDPADVTATRL